MSCSISVMLDDNNNETPSSMPKEFFFRGLGLCSTMSSNSSTATTTEATIASSTSSSSPTASIVQNEQRRRKNMLLRLLAKRSDISITSLSGQMLLARSPLSAASSPYQRKRHERAERYCTKTDAQPCVSRRCSRLADARRRRQGVDVDTTDDDVQRRNGALLAQCAPLTVTVQRLTEQGIETWRSMWKTFGWSESMQMRVVLKRIDC